MTTTTKAKDRTMKFKDGILSITEAGKTDAYAVQAIRDEAGETVLGYRLAKTGGETYDVELLDGTCHCLGNLRYGYCRHVSAVYKLRSLGMI